MKITVLTDEATGRCPGKHGLSFFVEVDGKKILFDLGPSEIFRKNAEYLNVNLNEIDYIVLSHGHYNHGNGLKFIKDKILICHPDCFAKRYMKIDDKYIGLPMTLIEAKWNFRVILSEKPYNISNNIFFLGEIPRKNDFEAKTTQFYKDGGDDDFVMDESALVIKSDKGLIILTGCSHAGICNIIQHAKKVTGIRRIHAVIGGLHLNAVDDITMKTIEYLEREKVEFVYASHCTAEPVLKKLAEYESFHFKKVLSGDVIEIK